MTTVRFSFSMILAGGALLAACLTSLSPAADVVPLSGRAPDIISDTWLNASPTTMAELRGKVVLVEFWTFECWNCHNVEPYIKQWHSRFRDAGLEVISVHAPEFDRERDPANVRAYVDKAGISYAVAIDNDFANWKRYRNRFWPTLYLIDKHGMVRYSKIGEGDYAGTEQKIRALLQEAG